MADTTALKNRIRAAIKANDNQEITGPVLQQALLDMVDELNGATETEADARQNADGTLQGNIESEASTRSDADTELGNRITTLQRVVNGIKSNIENGYVYAGIATPSTTPAAGKVFYLALTAGTYTNFNRLEVSQGINILKNNGSTWSLDSFVGIDDAPAPSSQKLVKSGGVFDEVMKNGSAFDLSAYNGGATYADLNPALTALNALPAAYKRGGMSMKFVLSSDNKYVQARCMAQNFTTDVTQWQGVDDEPTVGSNNLVKSGGVESVCSVIANKINRLLVVGKNLYAGKLQGGKYIEPSGNIANTTYDLGISNIIPIIGGKTIYLSNSIAFNTALSANVLDTDFEVIDTIRYTGATQMSFATTTSARYIQLSIYNYSTADTQQLMVSYEASAYEKPKYDSISNVQFGNDVALKGLQKDKIGAYYTPVLIYGKYIDADGSPATNTNFNITGFLPYDGNGVRYENIAVGNVYVSSICFYADDKTTVTKKVIATSTTGVVDKADIPNTSKYFRCSVEKNNTLIIRYQDVMNDNAYYLGVSAFNSLYAPTLIANKYLKTNGTEAALNNSYITEFIRWYGGNIGVKRLSGAAVISICFYSSADESTFLGGSQLPNGNTDGYFLEEQIPSGTTYFRLSTIYNDCKISCQGVEQLLSLNQVVNTPALDGMARLYRATLNNTEQMDLPNIPSIKNKCCISFMANITTMGYIDIIKGPSLYNRAHVRITSTQIMVEHINDGDWDTFDHGLTIEDYIVIRIEIGASPKDAKITITTINNASYSCTTNQFDAAGQVCFAKANNGTQLTDCILSFGVEMEDVLIMSDSYSDLFPPYLNNFKGYQIDGLAGRQSPEAYTSLTKVLTYFYRPKTIVWMLGMNDADNSDSINASYKTYLDMLIELCSNLKIKLVVCTIPNTPTQRHTFKNTYIKQVGVSFIDMAALLNASEYPSSWYSNYLSPDNVHPRNPDGCQAIANIIGNGVPLQAKEN